MLRQSTVISIFQCILCMQIFRKMLFSFIFCKLIFRLCFYNETALPWCLFHTQHVRLWVLLKAPHAKGTCIYCSFVDFLYKQIYDLFSIYTGYFQRHSINISCFEISFRFEVIENLCLFEYLKIKVFVHTEQLPGYDGSHLFGCTIFFCKEFICYTVFIFLKRFYSFILLFYWCSFVFRVVFSILLLKLVFKLNLKCSW